MTTLHKLTLGGIAAVCVLVIAVNLGTSKGPATSEAPPVAAIDRDAPATTTITTSTPATPVEANPGDGTPIVLGPRLTEARGLEDLVSEIREVTGDDTTASSEGAASHASASSTNDATPDESETSEGPVLARIDTRLSEEIVSPIETSPAVNARTDSLTDPSPAAEVQSIEPQTLTLGPAPKPVTDGPPAITDDDLSAFSDIPEENELPPVEDETLTARAEVNSDDVTIDAELLKGGEYDKDTGSTLKPLDVPADPPGTVAPIASSPKIESVKANEPAQIIAPPPAKANEPALVQREPSKQDPPAKNDAASRPSDAGDAKPAIGTESTYAIQPGDTFSSIAIVVYGAERHWLEIADANPDVDPKRLKVGQVIKLSRLGADASENITAAKPDTSASASAAATRSAAKPTDAGEKIHEVKSGENLSSISRKYFDTPDHWRHIFNSNRQTIGSDPGKLQAGMKLKITQPPAD